jgi:hypothetical protein
MNGIDIEGQAVLGCWTIYTEGFTGMQCWDFKLSSKESTWEGKSVIRVLGDLLSQI